MNRLVLNERNIFLIDGCGALLSACITGLIMPLFTDLIGLSKPSLYSLAEFPLIYCLYSFSIYFFAQSIKPFALLLIMIGNLFYCFVSARIAYSTPTITVWGQLFLISEIIIILAVVALEAKIYRGLKA